jgi:hypothetical protein
MLVGQAGELALRDAVRPIGVALGKDVRDVQRQRIDRVDVDAV